MRPQPSSNDAARPAIPSTTWSVIRSLMLRSARLAIVWAALSETFEVNAAKICMRCTGFRAAMRS